MRENRVQNFSCAKGGKYRKEIEVYISGCHTDTYTKMQADRAYLMPLMDTFGRIRSSEWLFDMLCMTS